MTTLALTNEKINSYGGLSLAGKLLAKFCRIADCFKEPVRARRDRIADADILVSQIGLLVQGAGHHRSGSQNPESRWAQNHKNSKWLAMVASDHRDRPTTCVNERN